MSSSSDDLGDLDGYIEQLPFDPRETDHSREIQDLYGQVSDDIVQVMEDLTRQRDDATDSAIESMMSETYNQGVIDGVLAGADVSGDNTENHFPNGLIGDGNYKSPVINIGSDNVEQTQGNYKSPKINVGSVPTAQPTNASIDASRIPDSWDEYSLGGGLSDFELSGEPEFDSPETYLESRDTGLGEGQTEGSVSVNVSYGGASDDDLAFLNAAS
jgi:hypothetical protein